MAEVDPTWKRVERKIDNERASQVDLMLGTFRNFQNELGDMVSPSDLVYAYLPDEFQTTFTVLVGTREAINGVRVKPRTYEMLPVEVVRTDEDGTILQNITIGWDVYGMRIARFSKGVITTDMRAVLFDDPEDRTSPFIEVVFIDVQGEPVFNSTMLLDGAQARVGSIPTSA